MPGTAKVSMKDAILLVESSNLLKMAKTEKLIAIQPYQIRMSINLQKAGLTEMQEGVVKTFAQKEANRLETDMLKQIDELVKELKKLQEEDKRGNDKAGDTAEKKVKSVSDEIDDTLPEFGPHIRKAIEKAMAKKLPGASKTVASGGFRGIKLVAKFEHGGASAEVVKDYQDTAKSLDQAGDQAVTKSKEDKRMLDILKFAIKDRMTAVSKASAAEQETIVKEIPQLARSLGKEWESYANGVESFKDQLAKTAKTLEAEAKDLTKDLSSPEFRGKKDKLEKVRKELQELQKVVDKRLNDANYVVDELKDAESIKQARNWQIRLAAINAQVARFAPIDANDFNSAAEQMVTESKKKA